MHEFGLTAPCTQTGHGDEAVQVADTSARSLVVNRVATAQQSGHHGLGDARGKHRGDRGIRGAAALLEDLDSRVHRCGMSRRHRRLHRAEAIALQPLGCRVVDAAAQPALVHARSLVKRFDDLVAVDGIDFDVQRGEAFGFLGPNGAGKTSTMRMIGCVSPPSSGTLRILGLDPVTNGAEIRAQLCDRLVVMDKGTIAAEGSPQELIRRYSTREVVELRFRLEERPEEIAERINGLARRLEALPDRLLLYTDDGDATASRVHQIGLEPESVLVRRSTLEDVFLHLTGRTLVDE